jgi:hypothetical protein
MGHKDSFSGAGGNIGNDLRDGIDDWLANLPGASGADSQPTQSGAVADSAAGAGSGSGAKPKLSPSAQRVAKTALLFRTSGGAGAKARRGTAAQFPRSAATSSRIAGRGAAAAYAYRTGDRDALRDLGLDYDQLRANPNLLDVVYLITQSICEELPPGTIEADEQRHVVADIAEWVISTDPDGTPPSPTEIAQETLAVVLAWAYLTTTASELNTKDMTGAARDGFEKEVRATCEELAAQAGLDASQPAASEFTTAVEQGLEFLQAVYGDDGE